MRATYLPLIALLAACASGAAAVESTPVAANDPLQCALQRLDHQYPREGGSVAAGFLRYNTYRMRAGMMTLPSDSSQLTVTREGNALRVDAPVHMQAGIRTSLLSCTEPAPVDGQAQAARD